MRSNGGFSMFASSLRCIVPSDIKESKVALQFGIRLISLSYQPAQCAATLQQALQTPFKGTEERQLLRGAILVTAVDVYFETR